MTSQAIRSNNAAVKPGFDLAPEYDRVTMLLYVTADQYRSGDGGFGIDWYCRSAKPRSILFLPSASFYEFY